MLYLPLKRLSNVAATLIVPGKTLDILCSCVIMNNRFMHLLSHELDV
jgi:hypothetical protein